MPLPAYMKTFGRRALALSCGLLLSLCLLEGGLRIFGYWNARQVRQPENEVRRKDAFTILALGNSHTFGAGALPEQSYPAQLQDLFAKDKREHTVLVVNGGIPNATTGVLLESLRDIPPATKPDLVALMVGEPNFWNMSGYDTYLERQAGMHPTFAVQVKEQLRRLRTAKLFSLLSRRLGQLSQQRQDPRVAAKRVLNALQTVSHYKWTREGGSLETTIELLEAYNKQEPGDWEAISHLGSLEEARGNLDKALDWYERSLKTAAPVIAYRTVLRLRGLLKGRRISQERFQSLTVAVPAEPLHVLDRWTQDHKVPQGVLREPTLRLVCESNPTLVTGTCFELANFLETRGDLSGAVTQWESMIRWSPLVFGSAALENIRRVARLLQATPDFAQRLAAAAEMQARFIFSQPRLRNRGGVTEAEKKAWIRADLEEMGRQLHWLNIPFFFQTYPPPRDDRESRLVDFIIREVAQENKFPLLDTSALLNKAFKAYGRPKDFFYSDKYGRSDAHLNEHGYKIVAELMHAYLLEQKILPR